MKLFTAENQHGGAHIQCIVSQLRWEEVAGAGWKAAGVLCGWRDDGIGGMVSPSGEDFGIVWSRVGINVEYFNMIKKG